MSQQAKATEEQVWRSFPQFEKAVDGDAQALIAKIEKTVRRLDEFVRTGDAAEQTRAKAAMAAYGRTMDLYRKLLEMKAQGTK